ncbi:MAG: hypothetical protein AB7K24_16940 [Gemmataceae bacterium]
MATDQEMNDGLTTDDVREGDRLCSRIEALRGEGKSMDEVAGVFSAEGFLPRRVTRFSCESSSA